MVAGHCCCCFVPSNHTDILLAKKEIQPPTHRLVLSWDRDNELIEVEQRRLTT